MNDDTEVRLSSSVDGPINNYMVQQITEPEVHVLRV
jgi:hypothetical protein